MKVSVVYALRDRQIICDVELPEGATLAMAVQSSGLLQEFPEIVLTSVSLGVYGQVRPADTILQSGDRVEIYRKLRMDPKSARRARLDPR